MKANRKRLELAMARACILPEALARAAEMPRATLNNVIKGCSVRPATLGRVARALGVDVTELMEEENV